MKIALPFDQPDEHTCQHACLALITGKSIDYIIDWFGDNHALNGEEAIIFLAHHGIYLASYAIPSKKEYMVLYPDNEINVVWPVNDRPALLVVQSERFDGKLHAVFWDGEKVFDPNPLVEKPREISSYKIMEFWPLLINEEIEGKFPLSL